MAKRIGVLEADQASTDSPRRFEKRSVAITMVRRMEAVWIEKNRVIQKLVMKARTSIENMTRYLFDGPLGVGNLLPFSKPRSDGSKLHYAVPMAGDVGMRRHGLYQRRDEDEILRIFGRKINVSSRNLFSHQAIA
jgi:hypothetical protein